jgi:hypothetical protein
LAQIEFLLNSAVRITKLAADIGITIYLMNTSTITGKIYLKIFDLLKAHPEGIQWTQLNKMLQEAYPDFHPKTINGCVWKVTEKFPDLVIKAEKGLFKFVGENFNI